MNDGVFFAVSPLLWENIPYFWVFFCGSFLFFVIFFILQKYLAHRRRLQEIKKQYIHTLPSLDDSEFEKKAFYFLKGLIAYKFAPKHSFSHTNIDLISYCDDLQLKEIWKQLEGARYRSDHLSQEEKNTIHHTLQSYIL
ncbi:hypothetical protein CSB09_02110 [Candidatus Gracilibacteria bacterium]|nr:MAG: hypothetical protein CSB09_02110 [Candidatus Gracilibacteria bacterium]